MYVLKHLVSCSHKGMRWAPTMGHDVEMGKWMLAGIPELSNRDDAADGTRLRFVNI